MIRQMFRTWWGADDEPTIGPSDVIAAVDEDEARHIGTLAGEIKRWPCEILAAASELGIRPGVLPNGLATLSEDEEVAIVSHLADQRDESESEFQASDYPRLVAAFVDGEHVEVDVVEGVLEAAGMTADDFLRDTSELSRAHFQKVFSDLAQQYGE